MGELLASRFIRLGKAGVVRIDFDLDWFKLDKGEREFINSIIDMIRKYDGYCFPPSVESREALTTMVARKGQ